MDPEDKMYLSLFVTFFGFMLLMATILNKRIHFLQIMTDYFIVFMFLGVIICSIGVSLILIGHVENRKPFIEDTNAKSPGFLAMGTLLVATGFIFISYFKLSKTVYIAAISVSILGIISLVNGLRFFLKENFKKSQPHS
ncbi:MAG: hypothetical protein NDI94_01635 [Candidatus Woesearchaeota archaeon]|jgi:hypothetical protein|nr:hypothetical protein [Candidatus Woesearchaeota archaeon]